MPTQQVIARSLFYAGDNGSAQRIGVFQEPPAGVGSKRVEAILRCQHLVWTSLEASSRLTRGCIRWRGGGTWEAYNQAPRIECVDDNGRPGCRLCDQTQPICDV